MANNSNLNLIPASVIAFALDRIGYTIDENGCHIWKGGISTGGYGRVQILGKRYQANRAAWVAKNGPMLATDACHKCDNRKCINPDHIFPGSRSDNMLDAARKRRITAYAHPGQMPKGERHGMSKLAAADVEEILTSLDKYQDMASRFDVSISTITRIKNRHLWRVAQSPSTKVGDFRLTETRAALLMAISSNIHGEFTTHAIAKLSELSCRVARPRLRDLERFGLIRDLKKDDGGHWPIWRATEIGAAAIRQLKGERG